MCGSGCMGQLSCAVVCCWLCCLCFDGTLYCLLIMPSVVYYPTPCSVTAVVHLIMHVLQPVALILRAQWQDTGSEGRLFTVGVSRALVMDAT